MSNAARPLRTLLVRPRRSYLCCVVAVAALSALEAPISAPKRQGIRPGGTHSSPAAACPSSARGRPIYAYSVVPGGVYSDTEIREAIARDDLVAEHYGLLRLSRLRKTRLVADRAAFVSFRIRNRIFWTKRPIKVSRDEEVLSDGENLVRARCGNRISPFPHAPTLVVEPPDIKMDEVEPNVADRLALPLKDLLAPPPQELALLDESNILPLQVDMTPPWSVDRGTRSPGIGIIIAPLAPVAAIPIAIRGGPRRPLTPVETPAAPVPEPGSVFLVGAALLSGLALKRWAKHRF